MPDREDLLDDLRVASPCNASWEAMKGDDRVRFCGECQQNVYDLSALPRGEALDLIAAHEESLCIRLHRRADGTVLTADCPTGARRKRVRLRLYGAAGAGALAAATAVAATTVVMGGVRPRPHETTIGELQPLPDTYVPQPLPSVPTHGPVFIYRQDQWGGRPATRWTLWVDGSVQREVGGLRDAPLTSGGEVAAQEILRLAGDLRAEAAGAVPAYADSVVPRGYEMRGTGGRQATDADRARLFELAGRVRFAGDGR